MANGKKQGTREQGNEGTRRQGIGAREQGTEKQGTRGRGDKGTRKRATRPSQGRSKGSPEATAARDHGLAETPAEGVGTGAAGKAKRKWRGNGAARLKKAADQVVAENSEELARLLLKDALKGKMESARLLVTLAEKTEPPKAKRRGRSAADILAAEPEWDEKRHGGLTAADLPGSEEDWESETAEAVARGCGLRDQGLRDQGLGTRE